MLTDEEAAVLRALRRCVLQDPSRDIDFVGSLDFDQELTPRQRAYLLALRWKYRRQIDAAVPLALEALVAYRARRTQWAKQRAEVGSTTISAGEKPRKPADPNQPSLL